MGNFFLWIFLSIIGYFIAKKWLFKAQPHSIRIYAVVFSISALGLAVTTHPTTKPATHYLVKKVKADNFSSNKATNESLNAEKSSLQKQADQLKEQVSSAEEESEAIASSKETQSSKAAAESSSIAQAKAQEQRQSTTKINQGDFNTATTGRIVGNARSKIYHVPGQAGYNMNSANAVFFNSEQEAIAAGYRRAKR
ncbi:DNA-entry nuclease [Lactobacillus mulieris]|jgi:hypothetical protein|uniref:DNA-entry nuclease n=1 Tax=Lactobacillus mulieris TaxID=2508708 RepID=A0AAP3M3W9_9LACO|nr:MULTISPECIES: hypothetical protein [Lactobacillus]EEU21480.1 hypothetical protein HMPREF0525_00414 [Lactobacillus jensenii 27-2-CHN]EEX24351.1 hypothetical protein HMPREF0974_00156 [Lactobacillus jensenii 115-3-CHN]EFH29520.1 hypothetical protein HMPREF0526_11123 [Lactobacillus jensenii JV-V16]KAA9243448.1 DNA-entry nuclease [Lactobacillus jensenii]KAA9370361.1 DNA-entry nuclease [Lactobacillus jensenii]